MGLYLIGFLAAHFLSALLLKTILKAREAQIAIMEFGIQDTRWKNVGTSRL